MANTVWLHGDCCGEASLSKEVESRDPETFEWVARELYEAINGGGTWTSVPSTERSRARQWIRAVLASFEKYGWHFNLEDEPQAEGFDAAETEQPSQDSENSEEPSSTDEPNDALDPMNSEN